MVIRNSEALGVEFPTSNNLIASICGTDKEKIKAVLKHADETRIGMNKFISVAYTLLGLKKEVIPIIAEFIEIKRTHGTSVEKELYAGMTVEVCFIIFSLHQQY